MNKLIKLTIAYVTIGLTIGSITWLTDETATTDHLLAIPVIAILWPLYLYLLTIFH